MDFNELKYKAAKVSDEKFGRDNPITAPMLKLVEEIAEVIDCVNKGEDPQVEFADCFLLLVDAYRKYYGDDVDMQTLIDVLSEKLDVVASRKWGKPNEHGVYKHIKDPVIDPDKVIIVPPVIIREGHEYPNKKRNPNTI